jgi:hypothetical protein
MPERLLTSRPSSFRTTPLVRRFCLPLKVCEAVRLARRSRFTKDFLSSWTTRVTFTDMRSRCSRALQRRAPGNSFCVNPSTFQRARDHARCTTSSFQKTLGTLTTSQPQHDMAHLMCPPITVSASSRFCASLKAVMVYFRVYQWWLSYAGKLPDAFYDLQIAQVSRQSGSTQPSLTTKKLSSRSSLYGITPVARLYCQSSSTLWAITCLILRCRFLRDFLLLWRTQVTCTSARSKCSRALGQVPGS